MYNDNNMFDDEEEQVPFRPTPEPLDRTPADPWFVMEPAKEKPSSKDAKKIVKTAVSLVVSLVLFAALIGGGILLFNMLTLLAEGNTL